MSLRALSLCSGIEAASVAASPLGWRFVAFSEIEAFPSAVLAHHYPDVPNHGDMLAADWSVYRGHVDIVVGGTPCQAFSVAGLRGGLTDARGDLTMQFVKACDDIDPAYVLWENVPGVLSDRANSFGCFLGALCGENDRLEPPGGRWLDAGYVLGPARTIAWRVLDAQYFGLAQRRRRVFVVACPVGGSDPRQILFECDGVRRDLAPSRETGASVAGSLKAGAGRNGADDNDAKANRIVASTLETTTHDWSRNEPGSGVVAYSIRADAMREGTAKTPSPDAENRIRLRDPGLGVYADVAPTIDTGAAHGVFSSASVHAFDARQQDVIQYGDMTGPLDTDGTSIAVAFTCKDYGADAGALAPTLRAIGHTGSHANAGGQVAVAFAENSRAEVRLEEGDGQTTSSLKTGGGKAGQSYPAIATGMRVRRLTPRECERLQGFPDDYTLIPLPMKRRQTRQRWSSDGSRYKALGNSWAVPCVRWIFARITADWLVG